MQFRDKLFNLRKKIGLTQAELADALDVSRQAISKWEMGTTIPDIANVIALSKIFNVTIDYLVNDEIKNDSPVVKTTATTFRIKHQYILSRKKFVIFCLIILLLIVGIITHSFASTAVCLSLIGIIFSFYYGIRLLMSFFINRVHNQKSARREEL